MINVKQLIDRICNYVENGRVDKAVYACVRLARQVGDIPNLCIFLRELGRDDKQLANAFFGETSHLNEEAQKYVWRSSLEHWSECRTLPFSMDANDDVPR